MKNRFLLICCAVILFISSCKQNAPQLALYIPKDAATVFVVDAKAISDKISSSGITLDSLANMLNKNDNGLHWRDIENSGIDLTKQFFMFQRQNSSMQNGKSQSFGLIAAVTDKSKLESFLKKQITNASVKQDDKYSYVDMNSGTVIGWTKDVVILSGVTANGKSNEVASHQQLTTLFTQSESNSVASIDVFKDAINKPGDIHFWSNASGNLSSIPMVGMTKLGSLFEDTYTDGTINFEKGKVVATAESHYNKTFADLLNKYSSRAIDKSMISRYPQPANGFGIIAFNPKVLLDILHYLGFDAMADGYVAQLGFTTTDLVNAFKGDIAVIFSRFKMEESTAPNMPGVNAKKPGGDFLLNAVIGDKTAFDKVMNALVAKKLLSKNGDEYELGVMGGHDFVIETTNNNLFVASNDAIVKAYESGNNKSGLTSDVENEISGKSMAIYFDIATMLEKSNSTDTSSLKTLQLAQATFKNIIASTDKSDGKTLTGSCELNMVNQNENSLAGLVKFITVAHEEHVRKNNNWNRNHFPGLNDSDSTMNENDSDQNNQ